jgi:hypothetical protein
MEIFYDANNTYAGATATTPVSTSWNNLVNNRSVTMYSAASGTTGYAVAAQLKGDPTKYFCIDALGNATTTSNANAYLDSNCGN